jgi:hypothetical protein
MILFKKFFRLTFTEKWLFIEAAFLCSVIKLVVLFIPIKKYQKYLGEQNKIFESPLDSNERLIYRVSSGIVRSRKVLPWQSKCLTEAIVAKLMLRRRKIGSTLYLGVYIENEKMQAHAWLKYGDIFITGRKGSSKFTVVSTFA